MKRTWLILSGYDGNFSPTSVMIGTEEEVSSYCRGMVEGQELEAYSMDEDDPGYDPFPYIEQYKYQEIEQIDSQGNTIQCLQ